MNEKDNDQALSRLLRKHATRHQASGALQSAMRTEIALESVRSHRPAGAPANSPRLWRWPTWGLAGAGFALGILVTVGVLRFNQGAGGNAALEQELAGNHVRALMVAHLTDVTSTDLHTVKPWFQGRLDYSPPVKDLAPEGYPLVGGRLDYVAGRPIAALVYRRNGHLINLFVWPAAGQTALTTSSQKGYNLVHWRSQGMEYWAVSDVNGSELQIFSSHLFAF